MTGTEIKNLRESAGVSQEELAAEFETHQSVISCWERGVRTPPAEDDLRTAIVNIARRKMEAQSANIEAVAGDR